MNWKAILAAVSLGMILPATLPGASPIALPLTPDAEKALDVQTNQTGILEFDGTDATLIKSTDPAAYLKWRKSQKMREFSAGFSICFKDGAFNAYTQNKDLYSLGLFDCSLTKDGKMQIRFMVRRGEVGPEEYVITSKDKVEFNRWYDVAVNYSMNRRRATLYWDGKLQKDMVESFPLEIQHPDTFTLGGFKGAVKNIKVYDAPLYSEDLTPAYPTEQEIAELAKQQQDLLTAQKNDSPFKQWIASLVFKKGSTIAEVKKLRLDLANAAELAKQMQTGKGITGKAVTVYSVPPTGQEFLSEYKLPEEGKFTDTLQIIAAKNEVESASFLLFAFNKTKLTFKVSDLYCGNEAINADALDMYMVKRWIRCGGAWMSYHADKYQRLLVPDLLLKDENMIRVDEIRRTNELRLTYPEKTVYADVSQFSRSNDPGYNPLQEPLNDADELQPVTIPEGGRTQQMWINFKTPAQAVPGLYEGSIRIFADGKEAGVLKVQVRILPFELPEAKTYYDSNRNFISWLTGTTNGPESYAEKQLKFLSEHSIRHFQAYKWDSEKAFTRSVELMKKYGFDTSIILGGPGGAGGHNVQYEKWLSKRTMAEYLKMKEKKKETVFKAISWTKKHLGHDQLHFYGNDEAAGYRGIHSNQEPFWTAIREAGGKISAASTVNTFQHAADLENLFATVVIDKAQADMWHSVGARCLNYADPFSGPENPFFFRRKCGLMMYKDNYDGFFLLSFTTWRVAWNEFANDPGGDGNYRNFGMCYPAQNGPIGTMAMCGLREGLDDIRYATLLKSQAEKAIATGDLELEREGKRQLAWLNMLDGRECDLDYARMSMIDRIIILQKRLAAHGGKK